jgi:hypothetical protein
MRKKSWTDQSKFEYLEAIRSTVVCLNRIVLLKEGHFILKNLITEPRCGILIIFKKKKLILALKLVGLSYERCFDCWMCGWCAAGSLPRAAKPLLSVMSDCDGTNNGKRHERPRTRAIGQFIEEMGGR